MLERLRPYRPFTFLAVLFVAGCFEDPIDQKVTIEFLPKDRARITTTIVIHGDVGQDNRAARGRIVDMRRQLRDEVDEWSKRYAAIDADTDRLVVERSAGEIDAVERTAEVDDDNFAKFFADTSLGVFVNRDQDWAEIAIYPGRSNRATREQRATLDERLHLWTNKLARYLHEASRVYRYLDRNPTLAEPLLTVVFSDFLPQERVESSREISEADQAMVDELSAAMEDAWNVLLVSEDEAFSVNELSSLVYDPFPADIAVKVPGRILDIEGFQESDEPRTFTVRRTTFWNALDSLRSTWVEPDPLTAWVNAARSSSKFDLDDFLSRPRVVHSTPDPDDLRKAIESEMRPLDEYRVRWQRN